MLGKEIEMLGRRQKCWEEDKNFGKKIKFWEKDKNVGKETKNVGGGDNNVGKVTKDVGKKIKMFQKHVELPFVHSYGELPGVFLLLGYFHMASCLGCFCVLI